MPNTQPEDQYVAKLERAIEEIWGIAHRFGIDPYPVHFELVPSTIMYEFGAYGLPGRFSHWSRGKAYYRMKTEYDYGLSKIYELVVNTNPSYAFLMEQNDLLQNEVVVAHVLGHCDFFKHNVYFRSTPPNMIDKVSVNADRIRQYEYEHGIDEVERFLDAVLAIEEHVDPNTFIKRESDEARDQRLLVGDERAERATDYDDIWGLEKRAERRAADEERPHTKRRFPAEPEKDLLLFMAQHAPNLEQWQRDILLVVREEMLYFLPQARTKVINEGWACLVAGSFVLTERGLLRYDALHDQLSAGNAPAVGSGDGKLNAITDRHVRRYAPTIRLRTKRGLVLEGAEEHRLSVGPDQWLALKDVQVGQRIPLSVGDNIWPQSQVPIIAPTSAYVSGIRAVAKTAGVNGRSVYRWLNGERTDEASSIAVAVESTGYGVSYTAERAVLGHKLPITIPTHIDEAFGEFLGYLIGDGNIHLTKAAIGFTSGDREAAERYAALLKQLFGIVAKLVWDSRTANGKGGRWRVVCYATDVLELLHAIGVDLGAKAPEKSIPDVILQSPKPVVSAFLRAYFDCDGCASLTNGVILSTFSEEIAQALQVLLLNYSILSHRRGPNTCIYGRSAEVYEQEIGFGLARKREKLSAYIANHKWFKEENPTDVVVSVEHGVADVYDITVDETHRYVAQGMLHHNSFWHSRITREMDLTDAEFTAFAQMHAGVLAPQRMRLNPYHLGYSILQDIERRWDNPTEEEQVKLGRLPGQGRAKLMEVRETESDISLLRNYLTKELVEDLDLYLYRKDGDEWVIVEKKWEKVRDGIIASLANFGSPYITIDDADFNGNTELLMRHHYEGQQLDLPYAEKTLEYVYTIWGRPVHLETIFDSKAVRFSYNGEKHIRGVIAQERGER